ncbi:MAG: hypothetical protein QM500_16810 [Methylococcales bacterium]
MCEKLKPSPFCSEAPSENEMVLDCQINNQSTRPDLRPYTLYKRDVEAFIDADIADMLQDVTNYPIHELYAMLKQSGVNLQSIRPVKKDRKKMLAAYKRQRIKAAERSYSKKITGK